VPNQSLLMGALAATELNIENSDNDYYLVLNTLSMLHEDSLVNIARLTLEHRQRVEDKLGDKSSEVDEDECSEKDSRSMLIFDAGQLWATDIRNVTEVLPLTGKINVFSEAGFAQGLVFSRGKPIPVFCTSVLTHVPPPKELTRTSSVLVIDVDGTRIGLMVTALLGVEPTIWEKDERAPMTIAGGKGGAARIENVRTVVRTQSEEGPRTVPTLDLTRIARALIAEQSPGETTTSESNRFKPAAGE
ncbi:MAG: chemotaxis protein CheW, partial [Thalassolituus sp.]